MGQHRAARRAKARRARVEYWRKMRRTIAVFAAAMSAVQRARRRRLVRLIADNLSFRMSQMSFYASVLGVDAHEHELRDRSKG